jgi:hypothetical protein
VSSNPAILAGHSPPVKPLGDSHCVSRGVWLILLGLAWLRKGFSLKTAHDLFTAIRNQRGAAGLKIVIAYKEGLSGTDPPLSSCCQKMVT